ncbi:MAG: hypothetical protein HY376_03230 [Candidatus Blackburnbacteria bacterium]|nr:hypothetical protein [Candidatus Blackburnbacteria bacterium]
MKKPRKTNVGKPPFVIPPTIQLGGLVKFAEKGKPLDKVVFKKLRTSILKSVNFAAAYIWLCDQERLKKKTIKVNSLMHFFPNISIKMSYAFVQRLLFHGIVERTREEWQKDYRRKSSVANAELLKMAIEWFV